MERTVSCLWREPHAAQGYRTGVSLHSHTNHSRESLAFLGAYFARSPLLRRWIEGQDRKAMRRSANPIAFEKAYWTPPLTPNAAFRLESAQIERALGLSSLVSISDHDTIGAPLALRVLPEMQHVPISVEWTVPFGRAVFHLGIHNLPARSAEETMQRFREFTQKPERQELSAILAWLDAEPDVLVVLNHPCWDLAKIGAAEHENALYSLLAEEGECIHALELSGIRCWEENQKVRALAEAFNQMIVSGGDRHGTEPNATVNLSRASTFAGFVHEIRRERRGHVLFLPQYRESRTLRVLGTILSAMREYPDYPEGSQRWDERVFHPSREGEMKPLARLWRRPPLYVRGFAGLLHLLDVGPVEKLLLQAFRQPAQRFAARLGKNEETA